MMSPSKKAFEIAYALWRLGEACGNAEFQTAIQSMALDLLNTANGNTAISMNAAIAALPAIRQFMSFASIAGLVRGEDAELISIELDKLNAAIQTATEEYGKRQLPDLDLQSIFTSDDSEPEAPQKAEYPELDEDIEMEPDEEDLMAPKEDKPRNEGAEVRQAKVIERIRQIGDCHLRDVQDYLPDVSERTLRYDLQELIAQGKIERMGGNGGPSIYYRLKAVPSGGHVQTA